MPEGKWQRFSSDLLFYSRSSWSPFNCDFWDTLLQVWQIVSVSSFGSFLCEIFLQEHNMILTFPNRFKALLGLVILLRKRVCVFLEICFSWLVPKEIKKNYFPHKSVKKGKSFSLAPIATRSLRTTPTHSNSKISCLHLCWENESPHYVINGHFLFFFFVIFILKLRKHS